MNIVKNNGFNGSFTIAVSVKISSFVTYSRFFCLLDVGTKLFKGSFSKFKLLFSLKMKSPSNVIEYNDWIVFLALYESQLWT